MTDRYFTLEEADALIPWVQGALESIRNASANVLELRSKVSALVERMQSNGGSQHDEELRLLQTSVRESTKTMQSTLDELAGRGIVVRDVQRGLIDFLSSREGRDVYLCWVHGETAIGFWHEVDDGFAGRQSL